MRDWLGLSIMVSLAQMFECCATTVIQVDTEMAEFVRTRQTVAAKLSVYNFGKLGVNVDKNPVQLEDGEYLLGVPSAFMA